MDLSRRDVLKLGGAAGALALTTPAEAQTPKRGGIFRFAGFDPPNFDPHCRPIRTSWPRTCRNSR